MKVDGKTYCLSIDYCQINAHTPITAPILEKKLPEILGAVGERAKSFCVLDLANCFFAISLHPASRNHFAFTFQDQ